MKWIRLLAVLLALWMFAAAFAGCGDAGQKESGLNQETGQKGGDSEQKTGETEKEGSDLYSKPGETESGPEEKTETDIGKGDETTPEDSDCFPPLVWEEITVSTVSFADIELGGEPFGLILSYYDGIWSRGFSWMTGAGVDESVLYLVADSRGRQAEFSDAQIIYGLSDASNGEYVTHKVWVTGLAPSTTYSYKVGGNAGWKYGVFQTESASPSSITAIQISDAQTHNPALLSVWENTLAQAVETAGRELDMVLYNGDQYDNNMTGMIEDVDSSTIDRGIRNAAARETILPYLGSLPYMAGTGNHEATSQSEGVYVKNFTVDYGTKGEGGYSGEHVGGGDYSFDYGFAHFLVIDDNTIARQNPDPDQMEWIRVDLEAASGRSDIKWIIVMLHIGVYATGDHSNSASVGHLVTHLAPIFSRYHVDLVLQAHDHTYNKTLPYRWDAAGYTNVYGDDAVVNFDCEETEYNGETYLLNPNGTFYVTTGAAGHRYGAAEKADGIWADLKDGGESLADSGLYPAKTFTKNTYKIEVGTITRGNSYASYEYDGVVSDQNYAIGDYASGNVNANMFGVLNLTEDTLTYDFYTVEGNTVKLFDSLYVLKQGN